jgi:hypothetical protein
MQTISKGLRNARLYLEAQKKVEKEDKRKEGTNKEISSKI